MLAVLCLVLKFGSSYTKLDFVPGTFVISIPFTAGRHTYYSINFHKKWAQLSMHTLSIIYPCEAYFRLLEQTKQQIITIKHRSPLKFTTQEWVVWYDIIRIYYFFKYLWWFLFKILTNISVPCSYRHLVVEGWHHVPADRVCVSHRPGVSAELSPWQLARVRPKSHELETQTGGDAQRPHHHSQRETQIYYMLTPTQEVIPRDHIITSRERLRSTTCWLPSTK